jgi:HSP20 family molecular chaperone IbpA
MASFTTLARSNGTQAARTARPVADWFGLEPLDLLGLYAPFANTATKATGFDIARTETGYVAEIPVPGYAPNQIEVTYKDNVLSISGKTERRSFTRSLVLPDEIDPEHVSANVEHGMLTLKLDRRPEAEPKRIPVSSN